MEKYRRRSLLELCFVALFIGNCTLIIISIFEDSFAFSSAAILLSASQIALFKQFQKKADVWKKFSISTMIRYLFRSYFPKSALNNRTPKLNASDKKLIRKRARNMTTGIVYQNQLQEAGSYEYLVHYRKGGEFTEHSLRVNIGSEQCLQPYSLNVLNAATLTTNTANEVYSLSKAASKGAFALTTGLEGLRPEQVRGGGDLIWQFQLPFSLLKTFEHSEEAIFFRRNSSRPYIKLIEFSIKGVEKYQYGMWIDEHNQVSFQKGYGRWENSVDDLSEVLICLSKLRDFCGRKPVGLRLLFTKEEEIVALYQAIHRTGITPDFITIDEQSGYYILASAKMQLEKFKISSVLLYSGMVVSELDVLKIVALGASACISTAPIVRSIVPCLPFHADWRIDKSKLVANYHRNTIAAIANLMSICRYNSLKDVKAENFYHNSSLHGLNTLQGIYFKKKHDVFPLIINN